MVITPPPGISSGNGCWKPTAEGKIRGTPYRTPTYTATQLYLVSKQIGNFQSKVQHCTLKVAMKTKYNFNLKELVFWESLSSNPATKDLTKKKMQDIEKVSNSDYVTSAGTQEAITKNRVVSVFNAC